MTVPASTRRAGPFSGNGVTVAFPFSFKVFTSDDITVKLADAGGVETTVSPSAYTVVLNADQDATPGGTVTLTTPPAAGESLAVVGAMAYDQGTDLPTGGRYSATVVENALDKLTILLQQLYELTGRSLTLPATAAASSTELPSPEAGSVIGWDSTASGLRNIDPSTLASVVAYANRRTLVADGGAAYYTLASDPGNASNCTVVVSGVVQTPDVDYTVSGTTLTPTTVWPSGTDNVVIVYGEALPVGAADSSATRFQAAGTGAVVTTVQEVLRRRVDVRDYGATGDGTTNDTAAVLLAIAALPATDGELYFPAGEYKLTSALIITKPRTKLLGNGAKLTQTGTLTQGINITADGVQVEGLWLYNARGGADYSPAGYTNAIGIYIGANYAKVRRCRIENWGSISVRIGTSGAGTSITDNDIVGIGAAGGLVVGSNFNTGIEVLATGSGTSSGVRIRGNRLTQLGQAITTADNLNNLSIVGNEIVDTIGQHAIYCDSVTNLLIASNLIRATGYNGIKVQITNVATGNRQGVNVTGNTIVGAGLHGVVIDYASGTYYFDGLAVTNNVIVAPASDGVNLNRSDNFTIANNVIVSPTLRGIVTNTYARNGVVRDNVIFGTRASGLSLRTESTGYHQVVSGNLLRNCVTADNGDGGLNSGIYTSTGAITLHSNRSTWDGSPPAAYNATIFVNGTTLNLYDNHIVVAGRGPSLVGGLVNTSAGPGTLLTRSDTGVVTLSARTDARTQVWTGVAAGTTVQFATVDALPGDKFRIVKQDVAGAGTLTVNLPVNSKTIGAAARAFADVEYTGASWVLTGYGAL